MNIWYKFEENGLKTLLCREHTVKKQSWPPGGHKCHLWVATMCWNLDHGQLNIEQLKSTNKEKEIGPLVATNVTDDDENGLESGS